MLTHYRPAPTLLSPDILPLCEAWKVAYADFLLRMDLLGHRSAILQYSFVDDSDRQKASRGEIDLQVSTRETPLGSAGRQDGIVCIGCAADRSKHCPRCDKPPVPPNCALCRLPIKGEHQRRAEGLRAVANAGSQDCQ